MEEARQYSAVKTVCMRIMLDTNVYDLLLSRPDIIRRAKYAVECGKVELLRTHIQVSELKKMPESKKEKREAILALSRMTKMVPVGAMMIGVSTCEDRIGDGCNITVADIQTTGANSSMDALIAVSADIEADIFVTEDKRLERRINRRIAVSASKLHVWRWQEFCDHLLSSCPPADQ